MREPTVRTVVEDEQTGGEYVILAYRHLTEREALAVIRSYEANHADRPSPKVSLTIHTVLGTEGI